MHNFLFFALMLRIYKSISFTRLLFPKLFCIRSWVSSSCTEYAHFIGMLTTTLEAYLQMWVFILYYIFSSISRFLTNWNHSGPCKHESTYGWGFKQCSEWFFLVGWHFQVRVLVYGMLTDAFWSLESRVKILSAIVLYDRGKFIDAIN